MQAGGNSFLIGQQKQQNVLAGHVFKGHCCCYQLSTVACFKWSLQADELQHRYWQ